MLTWDPRGFGQSGGVATVNDAEHEGRDVQRLLDWVAEQPVAELDGPADPAVGMVGGSYGGGIQLVTAAIDCRVDAIVPIIAWHSLGTSLYKADTVKIGWAGIAVRPAHRCGHRPARRERLPATAPTPACCPRRTEDWFLSRGPGELVEQIDVPTLIVQGTVDTLFTLDEALTNLAILESNGVPVGDGVVLRWPRGLPDRPGGARACRRGDRSPGSTAGCSATSRSTPARGST